MPVPYANRESKWQEFSNRKKKGDPAEIVNQSNEEKDLGNKFDPELRLLLSKPQNIS
jgi:hypothetical protein